MIQRLKMICSLKPQSVQNINGLRQPNYSDRDKLASLLLESYQGTIDQEFETYMQALCEIDRLFKGEYGEYLPQHSFVIERDGQIVSSALLTYWHEQPLLAYVMTLPNFKRQGFSRLCIQHVMQSLVEHDYKQLSLVVTAGNEAAMKLYQQLEFT